MPDPSACTCGCGDPDPEYTTDDDAYMDARIADGAPNEALAEVARLRGVVQRIEARHSRLRAAVAQVHAWPGGATPGKRMVDADDLLAILDQAATTEGLLVPTDEPA